MTRYIVSTVTRDRIAEFEHESDARDYARYRSRIASDFTFFVSIETVESRGLASFYNGKLSSAEGA